MYEILQTRTLGRRDEIVSHDLGPKTASVARECSKLNGRAETLCF